MLHVAVQKQHVRERSRHHVREPGADGAPLAGVRLAPQHLRPGCARACRRLVGRPIVHDQHVRDDALQARDDVRDRACLVEGRHDGDGVHPRSPISSAGSTSTDAAASVKTLTAEMIPIERRGGYEESSKVLPRARIGGGHENDRRELGHGATRVAAFLKAVDEMNAVGSDADADERHDGKERKQIEFDARASARSPAAQ
jgi:hypothetical protein